MNDLSLEKNELLFGFDPTPEIVAAEPAGKFIRLFLRTSRGVLFKDDPFHPFMLLSSPALLDGFHGNATFQPLQGEGPLRCRATFDDWHTCTSAKTFITKKTGKSPSASDAPYLFINDPVHQHLLATGKTLFKEFPFDRLRRLAFDIEVASSSGYEFPNPHRDGDRIIGIAAVSSDGLCEAATAHEMTEGQLIDWFSELIRRHDPDVIEGHNIFRFDLEYLRIRASRHNLKLKWGRDGSEPRVHPSRFTVAERIIDYPRWNIYGRHVIDTYFLLQLYDVNTRELEDHGLKTAARHFGLAPSDRVYLPGEEIGRCFETDPLRFKKYNLDDAREALALSQHLSHSFFLQTRIFPYSFQNCVMRGNATKINSLFLREYLHRRIALPLPRRAQEFEGGYTDMFIQGVVGPIVHCDVASLYPSILLTYGIAPAGDSLGLFLPLLKSLREFRLASKKLSRQEQDPQRRDYYEALQQTFKILINSFYGYLGTSLHNFSDPAAAAEVTRIGRETIKQMLNWLELHGAKGVEIDTDGIYFIPPPGVDTEEKERRLVMDLSESLPSGIDVEMDGRFRAMFSYKMKNYALLDYDGTMILKGSGLRSRGIEKYLREFMRDLIRLLLHGKGNEIETLYSNYERRLREHRFPITWLAKSETLSESSATYQEKVKAGRRNPSAAYEIALKALSTFKAGEQISFYISGHGKGVTAYASCKPINAYDPDHPDENVDFYREKLRLLKKKFEKFLPRERTLFD